MKLESHETQPESIDAGGGGALSRGLRLLFAVVDAAEPIGVTDVARRTGLHKATVSRTLAGLAAEGYLAVDRRTGQYVPGTGVLARMRTSQVERLLAHRAVPPMTRLRDRSGETVGLHVVCWPDRVCVAEVPSLSGLRRTHSPGETWPLTTGATGRAYLAYVDDDELDATLAARPLPHKTAAAFRRELAEVRRDGCFVAPGPDHIDGMQGMAAAIFDASSRPVAMISVSGPMTRFTHDAMVALGPDVRAVALELSAFLGYPGRELPTLPANRPASE